MATKFVEKVNPYLLCPSCGKLFVEPVINIHCGHTFCKSCFMRDDNEQNSDKSELTKCPVDSVVCASDSLVINRALLSQINDLLIYCQYGLTWSEELEDFVVDDNGCPEHIKLGERERHELSCDYILVPCPFNAAHCGRFRKKDLQLHIETCADVPCPYKDKGCGFLSSHEMAEAHTETCGYRNQQPIADISVRTLQEKNSALQTVVNDLKQQVSALEKHSQTLQAQVNRQQKTIETLDMQLGAVLRDVETLKSMRRVPSLDSSSQAAARPRRTGSSSSVSGLHASPRLETWTMPFTFKCIGTLRGHEEQVRALVTHKNLLFSCADDHLIKVWDLEGLTKGCVKTLHGHKDGVQSLATGDQYLYSGSQDGTLMVWSIADLEAVKVIQDAHSNVIAALVCSDDYLISSSHTVIKIWQSTSLEPVHTIKGLHHWVRSLAFNKSQDRFYSGSHNTIELWDCTGTFNLLGKISHSHGSVHSIALTPNYIIAGTYNQNVHMFNASTQSYVQKLSGHLGSINSVMASPSGRFLFTASKDSSIQVWNLENNLPIQNLQRHEGSVNALVLHNDLLLSGSEDKEIKVFKYFKMSEGFTPS